MNNSLKSSFYNGNMTSTGTSATTEQHYQMEHRLQYYSMRHKEHSSNTFNYQLEKTTTYTAVRDVVIEYYKAISAFSKMNTTSSAVGSNYGGGPAAMDVGYKDNEERKMQLQRKRQRNTTMAIQGNMGQQRQRKLRA